MSGRGGREHSPLPTPHSLSFRLRPHPRPEEVHGDFRHRQRRDGEEDADEARELPAAYHGEEDDYGVCLNGSSLNSRCQQIAFELLDGDVYDDREHGGRRRGEDERDYDRRYASEERSEVWDDRGLKTTKNILGGAEQAR